MCAESYSSRHFRENTRAPLQAPVTLQLDAFSEPMSGYTANVSKGGMFVQMQDLPPVGAIVKFQVELGVPAEGVRGTAEVVWVRTQAQGIQRPVGAGLQFRHLEGTGEVLLHAAVEKALQEQGPEPETQSAPEPKPSPPTPRVYRSLTRRDEQRKTSKAKKKEKKRGPKKKPDENTKLILGMPAERAKLILLGILTAFLLLAVLL